MKNIFIFALTCFIGAFVSFPVSSQDSKSEAMKVGVYISPPFVVKNDDVYSGMAIDLWVDISARIGRKSEFIEYQNYTDLINAVAADLINAVAADQVEAGVTNLTITENRARAVDFTHPWFDSGLRVMIHKEAGSTFSDILKG
ncbi:transporter substrate-binding domain-containing protein, partial [Bacillus anthracis]|uniref:transporter substrate-binding domain-containing protein n=1 Tax=Bacillus anthracis TaxID=1392 RepID=UPI0039A6FF03